MRYVDLNNPNPAAPFTSWATAATTIQDAIDAAVAGDEIVVTNGVYATGGRAVYGTMTNRVAVDKAVTVRSVNGPQFTIVQGWQVPGTTNGDGAVRCVYLTNGASISGFTLTNGATRTAYDQFHREQNGGGLWCESDAAMASNCVIADNAASWAGGGVAGGTLINCGLFRNAANAGGGAAGGTLNNCTIKGNSSGTHIATLNNCLVVSNSGIGVYAGTMNNCTVVGNSGIGAYGYFNFRSGELCTLNNSIVYYNDENYFRTAGLAVGYYAMSNCCVTPEFPSSGNITNEPLFVDFEGGDFRLQPNSPCVDAGKNNFVMGAADLSGAPRIRGSAVDMGAYEFQDSQPALRIAKPGENITLAWPIWASDFELQQVGYTPGHVGGWSNLIALPTVTNGENAVTLPMDGERKLFRLYKP